ncbi:MAG: hypothetical protein ACLGH8_15275, partial [Bacteroidia bacterium]
MKKYSLLLLFNVLCLTAFAQTRYPWTVPPTNTGNGASNGTALQICDGIATTPSRVDSDRAEYNIAPGCLGSTPNPAWYYITVGSAGSVTYTLQQRAPDGTLIDIDFILWGPFPTGTAAQTAVQTDPETNIVDCSYSGSGTEQVQIPSGQPGEIYLLLITNFSGDPGTFTMNQTGGTGTSACTCRVTPGTTSFTVCPGETATISGSMILQSSGLDASFSDPSTFTLTGPGGYNNSMTGMPNPNGSHSYSFTIGTPGTYTLNSSNGACGVVAPVTYTLMETRYPTAVPNDITLCGDPAVPNVFDLTMNTPVILNGQNINDYEIYYYLSQQDALDGNTIWPDNAFLGSDGQQIVASILSTSSTCIFYESFTLHVDQTPEVGTLAPMFACDTDNNGTETFNLRDREAAILGGRNPAGYTVTYYTSATDAAAPLNPIAAPQTYTTGTTTIHVRLENNLNPLCFDTGSFDIHVVPQPVVTAPASTTVCSSPVYTLPTLTSGQYYTQANGQGTPVAAGTPVTATTTYYVYASNSVFAADGVTPLFTCSAQDSFTVTIIPTPIVDRPANVNACPQYMLPPLAVGNYYGGPNGTGAAFFAGDFIISTRTMYVYASTTTNGVTCSDQSSFTITVQSAPALGAVRNQETCDDATNDQVEVFDLTQAGNDAINGQPDYTPSYYRTIAGANNADAAFRITGDLTQYSNEPAYGNPQTVYLRVDNTTGCSMIIPFTLTVHPKPVVPALADFVTCDVTAPARDGIEEFNLSSKIPLITTDPTDTVTFYTSTGGAQTGVGEILSPATYHNTTPWTEDIFIRLETANGCVDTGSIKLIVNPLPDANLTVPVFAACEENPNEGLFDLNEVTPVITNGHSGYI